MLALLRKSKGKKIPLVTINNSKINSNEKIKFWIQGGLHGDNLLVQKVCF